MDNQAGLLPGEPLHKALQEDLETARIEITELRETESTLEMRLSDLGHLYQNHSSV